MDSKSTYPVPPSNAIRQKLPRWQFDCLPVGTRIISNTYRAVGENVYAPYVDVVITDVNKAEIWLKVKAGKCLFNIVLPEKEDHWLLEAVFGH